MVSFGFCVPKRLLFGILTEACFAAKLFRNHVARLRILSIARQDGYHWLVSAVTYVKISNILFCCISFAFRQKSRLLHNLIVFSIIMPKVAGVQIKGTAVAAAVMYSKLKGRDCTLFLIFLYRSYQSITVASSNTKRYRSKGSSSFVLQQPMG